MTKEQFGEHLVTLMSGLILGLYVGLILLPYFWGPCR